MPAWTEHVIWWHVYPLGFVGADTTSNPHDPVQHRLGDVLPWLDDVVDLGANGLALGPIFDSETHGYDTIDHLTLDPRLGDEADFDQLIAACRERGIRVLLDGVFNHVARSNPLWQAAVSAGPGSAEAAWFRLEAEQTPGGELKPAVFEGHGHLVELDLAHPPVADYGDARHAALARPWGRRLAARRRVRGGAGCLAADSRRRPVDASRRVGRR